MGDSWWLTWLSARRELAEIERMLKTVLRNQERQMAQIDDLQAALTEIGTKVDGVAVEVQDLITRLSNLPPSPDLTAAIAQAQGILAKLQAIPPEPTA